MSILKSTFTIAKAAAAATALATIALPVSAADVTLRGASMFDEDHAYTKTLREFERIIGEEYKGDIEFEMHLNGELGDESDFVTFLQQGVAIDYAIMAPSNMAVFAPAIPLMDMPFLFRDLDHWNAVLSSDVLAPLEDELYEKADIKVIGYAGGGTRNLASANTIAGMDDLGGHKMRVMGAPIQAKIFQAITAAPSAIAYNEVYNAIQTGVIAGFENEAASIQNLKFYEVAKAGAFGREIESREDGEKLTAMESAGQITITEFEGREQLLDLVVPVQDDFASELGATELLEAVRGM